jgi:hypothetical protein
MRALVLGGPREGEWIDVTGGTWLDFLTGDTYAVRKVTWAVPADGDHPAELYKLPVAVHPRIVAMGAAEGQVAEQSLFGLVAKTYMSEFMRAYAEDQTPAPGPAEVPETPAELFDESGKPIDGGVPE